MTFDASVGEKTIEVQRHGSMMLVSSLGITFIGFLATIFYAHWVGAAVLGTYFIFLSSMSMIGLFGDFGIQNAAMQRICSGKDTDEYFTANFFLHLGIFIVLVVALIFLKNYFLELNQNELFWLLLFVIGLSLATSMVSMGIAASNRLGLSASASLLNNGTKIILQVILVFLGYQVYGLIGGLIAGLFIELLVGIRFNIYRFRKFDISHIISLFSYSKWAYLAGSCTVLFDNINLLIIAYFLNVSDVGIFGVCWTFSFFALFVSTALCSTLFVKVSRWNAAGDQDTITASLSRATTYSLIFVLPMLAGGIILGPSLLYYLYGASFVAGATALVIIIIARVFQSVNQLYSNYLMATDHVRMAFYGVGVGVSINIILSLILVPVFGINGAAIASLANVIVSTVIGKHYLRQIIPIIIERSSLEHIIVATVIMIVFILILWAIPVDRNALTTGIMVIAGAAIYFTCLLKLDNSIREDVFRTLKIQWIMK